jgi:hypothetical protein
MKQQPDSLFREKLEHLSMPAPEAAWGRIEKNLTGKKRFAWTLKIAAALVPIAVAAYVLWPAESKTENLAVVIPALPKASIEENAQVKADAPVSKATKTQERKQKSVISSNVNTLPNAVASSDIVIEEVATTVNSSTLVEPTEIAAVETKQSEEVLTSTVVFSAAEVDQKYLVKLEVLDATSTTETTSSFQKLLEKVSDLKHQQQGLGTLRQAKNEILALNFRNKKRERNN